MTLGDHPLLKTGVGTQSLNVFEALADSGLFCIRSIGGNTAHTDSDMKAGSVKDYGDDFVVLPTKQFGDPEMLRQLIRQEKPDIIWFMTDPRYYEWLWKMEDEIRPNIPLVYYHVWDNYPVPKYNEYFYDSTDKIVAISKLSKDVVELASLTHPEVEYIPHCIDPEVYKPLEKEEVSKVKEKYFPQITEDMTVFFYNSRNARRKQTGSLLFWFKELRDRVGSDKVFLILRTEIVDPNGTDLGATAGFLGLQESIAFVDQHVPDANMNFLYNIADVTVSVSDAEGFGLSMLESMSAGTPIMATETGGMMDQLYDSDGNCYGFPLPVASKSIVGSPQTPWVYEDRLDGDTVVSMMEKIVNMSREDLEKMGDRARSEHVEKNFNFEDFKSKWVELMKKVHEDNGSWPNKKYKKYEVMEIL